MPWLADVFPEGYGRIHRRPEAERVFDLANHEELSNVGYRTRKAWADAHSGVWPSAPLRLPPDTPRARVQLPAADHAPDILSIRDGNLLVSARMRYAMGLWNTEVQFLPIELIDGSDAAYQQDYRWMAWNLTQPAIDMEQSEYTWDEVLEGQTFPRLHSMTRIVWRTDADDGAGLFRCAEYGAFLLATETLAYRVDRAGCTGIRFEAPQGIMVFGNRRRVYRPRSHTPEW